MRRALRGGLIGEDQSGIHGELAVSLRPKAILYDRRTRGEGPEPELISSGSGPSRVGNFRLLSGGAERQNRSYRMVTSTGATPGPVNPIASAAP